MKHIKYLIGKTSRGFFAHVAMTAFVFGTSVGTAMILFPAGLICFGITCGIYGYLLGAE